ncbi:transcriptional regulator [Scandinavium goeteborgense]|uniref:winged helix-turn-helix domain-containing protein n=1 Tax=Scandinavium goeteborgense TaxID=1851514 RepID=UPI0037F48D43
MKKIYVINHSVRFDPLLHTLAPLDNHELEVTLHTPASECLDLLLNHTGEILSQNALTEEIWGKKKAFVATNTLYQTIASIRKGLRTVGLKDEILRTVPKQGFQLLASVEVREENYLLSEEELSPQAENDVFKEKTPEIFNSISKVTPPQHKESSSVRPTVKVRNHSLIFSVILFLICCGGGWLYMNQPEKNTFFSNYHDVGVVKGCRLYSSWRGKEKNIDLFTAFTQSNSPVCHTGDVFYMTLNRMQQVSSLLQCDKDINQDMAQCTIFVIVGGTNEN